MPGSGQILTFPTQLTIRPAGADKFYIIESLARRIWPDAFAGILTPMQIELMLMQIYSEESLEKEEENGHRFWLAYQGKDAVGYVSAYREKDAIWIKKLYVLTENQGQGIGKALLDAGIAGFLPAKELRLLVNRDNVAAQQFYERIGFTCIGEASVQMGEYPFMDLIFSKAL